MAAVLSAFVQYLLTFIYYIIIAGAGIFAGKALLKKSKEKKTRTTEVSDQSS